jgi:hypothetical protein
MLVALVFAFWFGSFVLAVCTKCMQVDRVSGNASAGHPTFPSLLEPSGPQALPIPASARVHVHAGASGLEEPQPQPRGGQIHGTRGSSRTHKQGGVRDT